ncbi:hypothetical protein GJ697_00565 [Pseudoduganella sp. FT25W]|jgi:hypothetical protein|uniref:MFS transporter n=1 Tax=Duganella alba TaxID=2666081 RepID=A0A6L5QB30_9BURK|nr:hypothetical protein [Duganella alba]MRX06321.1 hypothetical protein [Duganella alba]MRX14715.1 hypothetical protein [Duganella alba]
MHAFAHFFTGALLCNALPHLAAGLQGQAFPTPFAKPRGVGLSSALINVLWGFANLLAGFSLLAAYPVQVSLSPEFGLTIAGALLLGIYLAVHFSKARR